MINAPATMITNGNKYILAILNSKLGDWYIRQLGVTRNGGYFEYKPMFVEQLPIPKISKKEQEIYIELIDEILLLKKEMKDTKKLENKVNQLVYSLYGLFEDEINYFESQTN